jgi:hypothetical protein
MDLTCAAKHKSLIRRNIQTGSQKRIYWSRQEDIAYVPKRMGLKRIEGEKLFGG